MTPLRRALLALAFAGLAAYAFLAIQVYRSTRDPEGFSDTHDGKYSWMIGPSYRDLNRVARERVEKALSALADGSRPSTERLTAYRDHLARAEVLLKRSLRANALQPLAIAQIAAIRYELEPPADEAGIAGILAQIEAASAMAPRNPEVQQRLGELLLKMGRRGEGLSRLRSAVELDADRAGEAVGLLDRMFFAPEEIAAGLPAVPQVTAALYEPYFAAGKGEAFVDLAQARLAPPSVLGLRYFGFGALRAKQAERLKGTIAAMAPSPEPEIEAERLAQLAQAELSTGNPAKALELARKARALRPAEAAKVEFAGRVALAAGETEEAIRAYRDALGLVAREGGSDRYRAYLYVLLGQAEEKRGRPDVAYDHYKRALALDPERKDAAGRLEGMRVGAGAPK
jgi:tetratricopeptide (TPR) repeat protein